MHNLVSTQLSHFLFRKNRRRKHKSSIERSLSRLRSFVTKSPAAENTLSASALVGEISFSALKIFSKSKGRSPVDWRLLNSLLSWFNTSFEVERDSPDLVFVDRNSFNSSARDFLHFGSSMSSTIDVDVDSKAFASKNNFMCMSRAYLMSSEREG